MLDEVTKHNEQVKTEVGMLLRNAWTRLGDYVGPEPAEQVKAHGLVTRVQECIEILEHLA
jgi:hypothetical protein